MCLARVAQIFATSFGVLQFSHALRNIDGWFGLGASVAGADGGGGGGGFVQWLLACDPYSEDD